MRQVGAVKIRHRKFPENIIKDRCGILDAIVALNQTCWFKLGKGKGVDKLFQRHPILQPHGHCYGKIVHHCSKASAFFVHVDENFTQ